MSRSEELQIAYVPLDDLVPYERNSKLHPPEQVEQIAASIREFGDCDPIAVWHDADGRPIIVEGHGRLLALQLLGAHVAPTISLDHLSDAQRRAYSHVHNQTTLSSGLVDDVLALDMDELAFDWEEFGFDSSAGDLREIDVDDLEGDAASDATVSVDGHSFYVSRAEADALIEGFRSFSQRNGTTYGYLRSVLGGA